MAERLSSAALVADFPRPLARASGRQYFLVLAGLPVSGKSTFGRALSASQPIAHIASDEIRARLTGGQAIYDGPEHHLVHSTCARLATQLLDEGYHVLMDATNIVRRDRRRVLALAMGRPAVVSGVIWFEVPRVVADQRLRLRASGAHSDDFSEADASVRDRMAARATPPDAAEADLVRQVTLETEPTVFADLAARIVAASGPS